jgi:hypothetical protein
MTLRSGRAGSGLTAIEDFGADLAGRDLAQRDHGGLVLVVAVELDLAVIGRAR